MDNQKKNEIPEKVSFQIKRDNAKLHLLHSLSSPTAIPMMTVCFDQRAGGWSFVYDNDLKENPVPRSAVGRILFDIVADLKLFEAISANKGSD